ncbi:NAD(P)-binding domain-containing protein [Leucobacter sp. HNU]|uniref:NAD(P)-binding domain-containing protein n=1 Tax=Leucobacter sp. HNU TaxID=3236805 RepID=UPI003A810406
MSSVRRATVVVIGAGQAGLSAGYHLRRHGFASALAHPDAARSFVILDAETEPGGAWQHRWASLTMATVNHIFDLPGFRQGAVDRETPSREAVPEYFAAFEAQMGLPILRPVSVAAVRRADADPDGELLIESDAGIWRSRAVINATGTWRSPVLPEVPGADRFLGRQLHARDYVSLDEFAGRSVAVVGGGISAVQQLEEISRVARVAWYTRREPVFLDGDFSPEVEGRETIERVTADVEAGNPSRSVVSYTGLAWTPYARAARDRGALVRRPMFTAIEPHGVREADGSFTSVDTILWATGFRPSIAHLDPLGLRNERGGIEMRGTRVAAEPRVHLIGYGPSQSTVGANRAGRDAVAAIDRALTASDGASARPGSARDPERGDQTELLGASPRAGTFSGRPGAPTMEA